MVRATPLHVAVAKNHVFLVASLLAAGADENARDADRTTPLHAAAKYGRVACAELLVKAGAQVNCTNEERFVVS